jgi:hypothetical protein
MAIGENKESLDPHAEPLPVFQRKKGNHGRFVF